MATNEGCKRCFTGKMFSSDNNMDPGPLPSELKDLTFIEQQLICRISLCIVVHCGIASSGHYITSLQEINEPAIFFFTSTSRNTSYKNSTTKKPKNKKTGKNDSSIEFRVRRAIIATFFVCLKRKKKHPAYFDISQEELQAIPLDGHVKDIPMLDINENTIPFIIIMIKSGNTTNR